MVHQEDKEKSLKNIIVAMNVIIMLERIIDRVHTHLIFILNGR